MTTWAAVSTRTIAILLALTFMMVFILTSVFYQATDTLGNPQFYNDQLRQADIYYFFYDDVIPAILEEAEIDMDVPEVRTVIAQAKPYIISTAKQTLPPEWLRTQTELIINEVVPYVWGDAEHFKVSIPLQVLRNQVISRPHVGKYRNSVTNGVAEGQIGVNS